jgi:hypothetical protein
MTYKVTMPGAQPTQGNSNLTVFRRDGDGLKVITDMWNDDK